MFCSKLFGRHFQDGSDNGLAVSWTAPRMEKPRILYVPPRLKGSMARHDHRADDDHSIPRAGRLLEAQLSTDNLDASREASCTSRKMRGPAPTRFGVRYVPSTDKAIRKYNLVAHPLASRQAKLCEADWSAGEKWH